MRGKCKACKLLHGGPDDPAPDDPGFYLKTPTRVGWRTWWFCTRECLSGWSMYVLESSIRSKRMRKARSESMKGA